MCIRQRQVSPLMFSDEDLLLLQAAMFETLTTRDAVLEMIVCGELVGEELLDWLLERQQQGVVMPSVSEIVECLLDENDPECSWALPTAQGEALLHLTIDKEESQLEILETIQHYCCEEDFPIAASGDYLIQEMFRSVFAWGLVSPSVVRTWKSADPSSKHRKTIALQQTEHFCRIVSHMFTSDQDMETILASIIEESGDDDFDAYEDDSDVWDQVGDEIEKNSNPWLEEDGFVDSLRINPNRNFSVSLDYDEEEESSQDIESGECSGLLSMDDSMTFNRLRLFGEP